jgi:hypothetical protein
LPLKIAFDPGDVSAGTEQLKRRKHCAHELIKGGRVLKPLLWFLCLGQQTIDRRPDGVQDCMRPAAHLGQGATNLMLRLLADRPPAPARGGGQHAFRVRPNPEIVDFALVGIFAPRRAPAFGHVITSEFVRRNVS